MRPASVVSVQDSHRQEPSLCRNLFSIRTVRMAQLADVHALDLILAPTEQRGPRRVDAEEMALEVGDPEQVLGHLPDAIALARALRDLLLELLGKLPQPLLGVDAVGRFDRGGEDAADAAGRGIVGDRTVADGEAGLLP